MTDGKELRHQLMNIRLTVPEPVWDLFLFCRFLADRLPQVGVVTADELARTAEELIGDLTASIDRRTGRPFSPPLLQDRSPSIYDFMRAQLVHVGGKLGGDGFADALAARLAPPATAPVGTGGGGEGSGGGETATGAQPGAASEG